MHPSFRHVFGGEEITPEPPAVILHFGAHSSSFQVSGQFQPSKNILPNLYGKWMAMIIVIGRDYLILYGPVPLNEQFYKWGKRRSKCFLGHTLYLLPLEKWTGINLHSFLFRTSSFLKTYTSYFQNPWRSRNCSMFDSDIPEFRHETCYLFDYDSNTRVHVSLRKWILVHH